MILAAGERTDDLERRSGYLKRLEELCDQASPGPWLHAWPDCLLDGEGRPVARFERAADAAFVAAARRSLPWCLDALAGLEALLVRDDVPEQVREAAIRLLSGLAAGPGGSVDAAKQPGGAGREGP